MLYTHFEHGSGREKCVERLLLTVAVCANFANPVPRIIPPPPPKKSRAKQDSLAMSAIFSYLLSYKTLYLAYPDLYV